VIRRKWKRLKSGLYVPPFLKRLHRDERGGWYPCCTSPCGDCTRCVDNCAPAFSVLFTGLTNNSCSDCSDLLGPFVVPYDTQIEEIYTCYWYYEFPATMCSLINGVQVSIQAWGSEGNQLFAGLHGAEFGPPHFEFRKDYAGLVPCTALVEEAIGNLYSTAEFRFQCNVSEEATCVITALWPP